MSDSAPPVDPSATLGPRIATLRRDAGLTQPDLAHRAGVSISTVYRAEQGDPSISPRMVARIAAALSVDVSEISAGDAIELANPPLSARRAEEQHDEVIGRLDGIQTSLDEARDR